MKTVESSFMGQKRTVEFLETVAEVEAAGHAIGDVIHKWQAGMLAHVIQRDARAATIGEGVKWEFTKDADGKSVPARELTETEIANLDAFLASDAGKVYRQATVRDSFPADLKPYKAFALQILNGPKADKFAKKYGVEKNLVGFATALRDAQGDF